MIKEIVFDKKLPGFGERTRNGIKRYVVQYRVGSSKQQRRITLKAGISREMARKEAQKIIGEVTKGNDPQAAKRATRAAVPFDLFKAVADRFVARQAKRLRPSSLYSTSLYLMGHCKRLHALTIDAVTRRDIASVLSSIAERNGAVSADRARAALSAMFVWAMKEGLCEANPVIATNTYAGPSSRDRVLSEEEIVAIWNALPDNDYGTIVKLLFYAAARADEIGCVTWSEINLDELQIDLPAERSKNKRAFTMPLSDAAFWELLAVGQNIGERDAVFGRRHNGFSGWSKAKAELDAKLNFDKPWQLRDIRRTVATGMAELGVQPHVIEACLNHVSGHKAGVAGIYNRAVYAKEKREAFEIWANHLAVINSQASGVNVTRLHRA